MIEIDRDARGVSVVRLARGAALNRFDRAMLSAFHAALIAEAGWPRLRALVLRGEGRHFNAGTDLGWLRACAATGENPGLAEVLLTLDRMPCPVVAVVQGACIGAGVGLVAAADMVLASEDAFFSVPEVRVGLPTGAMTPLLVRCIGARQARRYALTGERIDAATARHLGLVHTVLAPENLAAALEEVLAAILAGAPGAQAATKRLLASAGPFDEAACALDADMAITLQAPEAQEGFTAFAERRAPSWLMEG